MIFDADLIQTFRDDLCKDQREIKVMNVPRDFSVTGKIMRKYSNSIDEFHNEIDVMTYLQKAGMTGIPKILSIGEDGNEKYLDIEYYDGIRVYNLLAYLRNIKKEHPDLSDIVFSIRTEILDKCRKRQIELQKILKKWAEERKKAEIYPQEKLFIIVKMLCRTMRLDIDVDKITEELNYIISEFNHSADVPFRDSTTKNMVIYFPELYLGNFVDGGIDSWEADEIRQQKLLEYLKNDSYKKILNSPIVDFDFSSCGHLTSAYDDPIGLTSHEIAFTTIPSEKELVWLNDVRIDRKIIAISYIIRYLRFGGRKMAYHIFHPNAYKYRFKYDNENFYFANLNRIVLHFWPDAKNVISEFIKFIEGVKNFDMTKVIDDVDEFELQYPQCNRKFYIDVFPY